MINTVFRRISRLSMAATMAVFGVHSSAFAQAVTPAPGQTQRAPTPPEATAPQLVFPPVENTVRGSEGDIVFPPAESLGGNEGLTVLPPPESRVPGRPDLNNEPPSQLQDGTQQDSLRGSETGIVTPLDPRLRGGVPAPLGALEFVAPGSRPGAAGFITAPIEPFNADEADALDYSVSP